MKKDEIQNKQNTINIILTVLGIVFLFLGLFLLGYDYYLEQNAINMSATIKTLDYNNGKYSALVTYKVEDKKYEKNIIIPKKNEELTVGDKILIKFDMYNPEKLIDNNHLVIALIVIAISIIILIISFNKTIKIIKTKSNIKKLFKNGYIVKANVYEIIVNNKGKKIKGIYPYKLRARYLNPIDNKEYTFDSYDTYVNLNEVIKNNGSNMVVVAIDKTNLQNYYVDIDSLFKQMKLIEPKDLMKSNDKEVKEESKEINEQETTEKISN